MKRVLILLLFAVCVGSVSAQSLTSIYPTSGHEGDTGLSEQIDGYGVHFNQGTSYHITLHLGNNSITGYNVQVVTSSRLTVSFDIPLNFPEGTYYFTLVGGVDSFTTINPVYVVYAPVTSGIAAIEASAISTYPVPALDRLYIKLSGDHQIQSMAIISLTGQTVIEQKATGNAEECVDLHNLAPGEYLLAVTQKSGGILRKKILVN